eukprot:TRINITY_DN27201_c0_g1_i1.p1 TRINITY_DN27201_c0_g1~~TRINITY_DN27201_c0_g1_i1.p1  ORF type:complete len:365 (+),score=35.03 TRINITY_DN27201_c0_g1_i1:1-1095(+)
MLKPLALFFFVIEMARAFEAQQGMELGAALQGDSSDVARSSLLASHQSKCWCMERTNQLPCCCCFPCCCALPRWAWFSLCTLAFYFASLPFVFYIGHYIMYPGDPVGTPSLIKNEPCTTVALNTAAHNTSFVAVHCSYRRPGATQVLPVILFGGNAMNVYSTIAEMPKLLPRNVTLEVFSMSFPGFQYSPYAWSHTHDVDASFGDVQNMAYPWTGQATSFQFAEALLAYAEKEVGKPPLVFGWSLGSSLAAGLATKQGSSVQCLVLGNPFTSMWTEVLEVTRYIGLPWMILFDRWPTEMWVRSFRSPAIVLSSIEDSLIPKWMHTAVYDALGSDKKVLIEKNADHMDMRPFARSLSAAVHRLCL